MTDNSQDSPEMGHPFTFTNIYRGDNVPLCGQCMKPASLHKFDESTKLSIPTQPSSAGNTVQGDNNLAKAIDLYGIAVRKAARVRDNQAKYEQAWLHATLCRQDLEAVIQAYADRARVEERNMTVRQMEKRYRHYAAKNQFTDRDAVAGYNAAIRDLKEEARFNVAQIVSSQDNNMNELPMTKEELHE